MAIRKQSKKRASEMREYAIKRKAFLSGKICPVTGEQASQVHHMKGRIGKLLNDTAYWLAVSHAGHRKIEENPDWAKQQGYSLSRLSK